MAHKVKWGVLGCATVARNLVIPGMLRAENSEFYAIASRDMSKIEQYRSVCTKLYDSYDKLLEDPEIEAVYIPLPNNLHCEWVVKAAQHGKHILCEKPIAMNYEETVRMAEAAKENNVYLMEAFMYRHTHKTKQIANIIKSGALGDIHYIHSIHGFDINDPKNVRLMKKTGGGALFDMGCYCVNFIDMVMELVGANIVSAEAKFINRKDINGADVDVRCAAQLVYDNGAICDLACWFDSQPLVETVIVGKKGTLHIPYTFSDDRLPITLSHYDFNSDPACQGKEIMIINPDYVVHEDVPFEESDRYSFEVRELSRAILEHTPPAFSIDASVRNMRVMEKLYSSLEWDGIPEKK